jgi:acetyltransferase-like isoleucine patch superfamily enzyme
MDWLKKWLLWVAATCKAWSFESFNIGKGTRMLAWRVRGARRCHLHIGEKCFIRDNIIFERPGATLVVGDRTFVGNGLIAIADRVEIGNDVMIAWGVTIVDHNSHSLRYSERQGDTERWLLGTKDWSSVKIAPVRIEDKAWIGFEAAILKGVIIGEGAIVAARAVVTKSVSAWTLVAGNPAKVVRELVADER